MESAEIRRHVHALWAGVAQRWGEYADVLDEHDVPLTAAMLAAATPKPGDEVLELACGPGGVGLAAAALVGPDGTVTLSDVAEEMTAVAAARAGALGVTNVSAARLDVEEIARPDESYDVVLCRMGLMFAVDPGQAVREIARVLRPGGRVAVATWGPQDDNPWLGLVFDAVSAELGRPIPPPGMPGPFSLDDGARLVALFEDADLGDVVLHEVSAPRSWASFEDWWSWTSALAGPLATILAHAPEETVTGIQCRLRAAVGARGQGERLELASRALVVSARRR